MDQIEDSPDDPIKERVRRNVKALQAKGATREQISRYLASEKSKRTPATPATGKTESALSGAASGATFSLADEIAGAAAAATMGSTYTGGIKQAVKNYRTNRDDYRAHEKVALNSNPKTFTGSALAGGLIPVIGTGGAGVIGEGGGVLNAMLQGAGYGALQGVGSSKELSDVPGEAATGAAFGAGGGALLHGAGAGLAKFGRASGATDFLSKQATKAADRFGNGKLGSALRTAGESIGAAGEANKRIRTGLANEGKTPESVASANIRNFANSGDKPELMADYSPQVRGLTKAVSKRSGPGQAKVREAITERNAGTRDRVLEDFGGGSAPPDVRPKVEQAVLDRSASAKQLSRGFQNQPIDDDVVNEVLSRPTFRDVAHDAIRLAADEGRQLPTKVVQETADHVPPEVQRMLQDASAAGKTDAEVKVMEDAFRKAGIISSNTIDREVLVPDVESLAYIDHAIRDRVQRGFEGASGTGKNQAAALQQGFQDIRERVASLSPEYDAYLTDYAARSKPIDAATTGLTLSKYTGPLSKSVPKQALGKGDPLALRNTRTGVSGLEHAVGNMDPESQSMFREAARTHMTDLAESAPVTEDGSTNGVLRSVFRGTPRATRARALTFDSPDAGSMFEHALGRERNMAATSTKLGGSDTAENLELERSLGQGGVLSSFIAPIRHLFQGAANEGDKRATDALYSALGDRLSQTGTEGIQDVVDRLLRNRLGQNVIDQGSNALRNATVPQLPLVGASQ